MEKDGKIGLDFVIEVEKEAMCSQTESVQDGK